MQQDRLKYYSRLNLHRQQLQKQRDALPTSPPLGPVPIHVTCIPLINDSMSPPLPEVQALQQRIASVTFCGFLSIEEKVTARSGQEWSVWPQRWCIIAGRDGQTSPKLQCFTDDNMRTRFETVWLFCLFYKPWLNDAFDAVLDQFSSRGSRGETSRRSVHKEAILFCCVPTAVCAQLQRDCMHA
jgi:hypothetical protein